MSTLDRPPPPPPPPQGPLSTTPAAPPRGRPAVAPPPRRLGRRGGTPVAASPGGLPTRRRWGRFAAGATLALLGAWIFAALYVSAGQRVEVLSLTHDVDQFHQLTEDDLRTVRVAADPGVETVKGGRLDDMVGRTTGVPIMKGTLLADGQLLPKGEAPIAADERSISLSLPDDEVPDTELLGGSAVDVIISPASPGEPSEKITGCWILSAGTPDENTNKRKVVLVVPKGDDEEIGVAAKAGRITLSGHGLEAD